MRKAGAFIARTLRATGLVVRDPRIPKPLRLVGGIALLPIPGPADEAVLLLLAPLLLIFYREPMREAWRGAARRDSARTHRKQDPRPGRVPRPGSLSKIRRRWRSCPALPGTMSRGRSWPAIVDAGIVPCRRWLRSGGLGRGAPIAIPPEDRGKDGEEAVITAPRARERPLSERRWEDEWTKRPAASHAVNRGRQRVRNMSAA